MVKIIKKLWNKFITSPNERKQQELSRFLDYCLKFDFEEFNSMKNQDEKEIKNENPSFSDLLSIANILAHYFISGIHQVCCLIDTNDLNNENEYVQIKNFLINDQGWKLLKVINNFNINGLLYNRDLAILLIAILPKLVDDMKNNPCQDIGSDVNSNTNSNTNVQVKEVKECFSIVKQISFKITSNELITPAKVKLFGKIKKSKPKPTNSDSDSDIQFNNYKYINMKKLNNSNISDTESESVFHEDNYEDNSELNDKKSEEFNMFDLSWCIVNILSDFCLYEQRNLLNKMNSNQNSMKLSLSLSVVESLIDSLQETYKHLENNNTKPECQDNNTKPECENNNTKLECEDSKTKLECEDSKTKLECEDSKTKAECENNTKPEFILFINHYRNLLLIASCTLSKHSDGLRLFETIEYFEKSTSIVSYLIEIKNLKEACCLTYGIIYLLTCISQNLPQTKEYSIVISWIRLFSNYCVNDLIPTVIASEDSLYENIETMIDALQQLIMSLQRSKILHQHRNQCIKKRHSKCNLNYLLSHHSDLLGSQVVHSTTNKSPICCIASISNLLLQILLITKDENLMSKIIRALDSNATCCCSKSYVCESLLKFILNSKNLSLQREGFHLIEYIFEMQATLFSNCDLCIPKSQNRAVSFDMSYSKTQNRAVSVADMSYIDMSGTDGNATDSAYCASDASVTHRENITNTSLQVSFSYYKNFFNTSDQILTRQVGKHLWALIRYCDSLSKKLLCQQVIFPIFFSKETQHHVIELLLQLIKVLVNDIEISKLFISVGGLKHLRKLLTDPINSSLALNVFEILIINEASRLKDIHNMIHFENHFPCLSTFFDIIYDNTHECINHLKTAFSGYLSNLDSSVGSNNSNDLCLYEETVLHSNRLILQLYYNINLWGINLRLTNTSNQYSEYIKNYETHLTSILYNLFQILFELIVQTLSQEYDEEHKQLLCINDKEEWVNCLFSLMRLVLPACLHMTPFLLSATDILIKREDIINTIKNQINALESCTNLQSNHLLSLMNLLIDVSLGVFYIPRNKYSMTKIWKNYFYLNDKIEKDLASSDDEVEDNGYEGDNEMNNRNSHFFTMNLFKNGNKNLPFITYGEICQVIFQFLVSFNQTNRVDGTNSLILIISNFTKLCHENTNNRKVLFHNNVLETIINGFKSLICSEKEEHKKIQKVLFEFFAEIISYKIDRVNLKLLFNLLKEDHLPLDLYLNCLNNLFDNNNNTNLSPIYCLSFPTESTVPVNSKSPAMLSWIGQIRNDLLLKETKSAWEVNSIALDLPKKSNPLMSSGKQFTVAFWAYFDQDNVSLSKDSLKKYWGKTYEKTISTRFKDIENFSLSDTYSSFEDDKENDYCIHIFSLGFDISTLEVWYDVFQKCFIFKLCKIINGQSRLKGEITYENTGQILGNWHLFCFNFKEINLRRSTVSIEISLSIDGVNSKTTNIPNFSIIPKHPNSTTLLLGSSQITKFKWRLGNFIVFKTSLSMEAIFYLYCLGSDFNNFSSCLIDDDCDILSAKMRFPNSLKPSSIPIVLEIFTKILEQDVNKTIVEEIMILYQTQYPNSYLFYRNISNNTNVSALNNSNNLNLQKTSRLFPFGSAINQHQVMQYEVIKFSEILSHFDYRIPSVITEVGGISSFMFIFIRIVEISTDPKLQAQSLEILYQACNSHNQLMNYFINKLNGLVLITHILENSKCQITVEMMKVIMKFVIIFNDNFSLIISGQNIGAFVNAWKAWHKNKEAEKLFYESLHGLISQSNKYRDFNIQQMKKGNVLDLLLKMLQEMFLQTENPKLSKESCETLLKIIPDIVGIPPDLAYFNELFDCTLLLHKPTSAYICNGKKSFYLFQRESLSFSLQSSTNRSNQEISEDEWVIINENDVNIEDTNINNSDEVIDHILAGFVSFMDQVIVNVNDDMLNNLIGSVLKLEYLIVLANNNSTIVRECVFQTMSDFIFRCKEKDILKLFIKNKGFYLLANQLHNYVSSLKLVEICFELILNSKNICLDEFLIFETPLIYNDIQLNSFAILFALLPQCIFKTELCHITLQSFNTIMESTEVNVLKILYDSGILESFTKVIINWNDDNFNNDGYEQWIIYHDICNCLRTLARKFFTSSGNQNYQIFLNIINFYSLIESKVSLKKCLFRACQVVFYETALDEIEKFSQDAINISTTLSKILGSFSPQNFLNFFVSLDVDHKDNLFSPEKTESFVSVTSFNTNTNSSNNESSPSEQKPSKSYTKSNDMALRFRDIIIKATNFILSRDLNTPSCKIEKYFARSLLHFLSKCIDLVEQPRRKKKSLWVSILLNFKEHIRSQISKLILYLLSTFQTYDERQYIANLIFTSFTYLPFLLSISVNFGCYLRAILYDLINSVDSEHSKEIRKLLRPHLLFDREITNPSSFREDMSEWMNTIEKTRILYLNEAKNYEELLFNRFQTLSDHVNEISMSITRNIVESQNKERKLFLYYLKHETSQSFSLKKTWKSLVDQLTHEKAIWNFPESYFKSWELDQTEGPLRIRRKLKRCHLDINEKFFLDRGLIKRPKQLFCHLFADDILDSTALIERLHSNERVIYNSPCAIITPENELLGEILISNSCIHFVCEFKQCNDKRQIHIFTENWSFEDIQEIQPRRYQLQNKAIEIFLNNGFTYLIAFDSSESRQQFQQILSLRNLPNLTESKSIVCLTQMWRERLITNFEYLTDLNKLAGRSHNDLMQYPVFPFIIANYESDQLDLTEPTSFRNLSKPMAIQHKEREKYYINQYNYIKADCERNALTGESTIPSTIAPYHYGSHYSNSGTVLHFLVRLPPFTEMFLVYQDNSFDIPDRTFHSIATTWNLASYQSTTDFKELVPEFFYLPEFLMNNERFNFGVRQNGELVDHVKLPKWCRENARLFVLINRQALESYYVTQHLNEWIDLVFGYKQVGKHAVEAINVFHPATYYGTDSSKIEDPIKRNALQTMIKTFGQMPRQLFAVSHPNIILGGQFYHEKNDLNVMGEVIGLKWGSFVGSPTEPDPIIIWKNDYSQIITTFVSLTTNDVIGLSKNSCLLLTYSNKQKGLLNASYITSGALITWGNPDGVVKIQIDSISFPLLSSNSVLDKITVCSSVPNCDILLVGYSSGAITVYTIKQPIKINDKVELKKPSLQLYGHESAIKTILICKSFLVAISGDANGYCIAWDLNRFCYTRTIVKHDNAIELICISETLGDIVTVSHSNDSGSMLNVHSINGEFIGQISTECKITAVCYSNAPEGISVNVIATGFANGLIKLWSSWDLTPVRELRAEKFAKPINSLIFSNDNNRLYVAYVDGKVFVWEKYYPKKYRNPSLTLLWPV